MRVVKQSGLDEILAFDPLAEAERITGQRYKEDEKTQSLGILLHLQQGQMKRDALIELGDLHRSIQYDAAKRLILNCPFFNFTEEWEGKFKHSPDPGETRIETESILVDWTRFIFIYMNSYTSGHDVPTVNQIEANLQVQVTGEGEERTRNIHSLFKVLETGGCIDQDTGRFRMSYHMLEGGIHKLTRLDLLATKKFVPWKSEYSPWILNYEETSDEKIGNTDKFGPDGYYDRVTEGKINKLPVKVRALIRGELSEELKVDKVADGGEKD
jgi:hypothetical protein